MSHHCKKAKHYAENKVYNCKVCEIVFLLDISVTSEVSAMSSFPLEERYGLTGERTEDSDDCDMRINL